LTHPRIKTEEDTVVCCHAVACIYGA